MNIPLKNTQLTERERVMSYLLDSYIVDVGFIKDIETDNKFVDVIHANKTQVFNSETGEYEVQEETVTKHIEVLYFGGASFSLECELAKGDVGLLLGTMAYVEKVRDITKADESEIISNYRQENLKFLPISSNNTPTTLLKFLSDEISLESSIKNTTISLKDDKLIVETDADLEVTANGNTIKTTGTTVDINGNSKKFVTYTELNNAITTFLVALAAHVHTSAAPGSPTSTPSSPITFDISAAESQKARTG